MRTKKTILVAVLSVLGCLAFSPGAHGQLSPPPDGCFPNFTTAEGCDALSSLTVGAGNTALGWRSLFLTTTGSFNTGVGGGALALNNGSSNTAVGVGGRFLNTHRAQNNAGGTQSLRVYHTGPYNNSNTGFSLI